MTQIEPANAFVDVQNEPARIDLLLARRRIQQETTRILSCQLLLVVLLPVIIALVALRYPDLKPVGSGIALAMGALDIFLLDRMQKARLVKSAKLQEEFDCAVFELPWNDYIAGPRLSPGYIAAKRDHYLRRHSDRSVRSWYPESFGSLPLMVGRLAAQQINMAYDRKMRRSYRGLLLGAAMLVLILVIATGAMEKLTLLSLLLGVAIPVAPIVNWCAREVFRQHDALAKLDATFVLTRTAWSRALAGSEPDMVTHDAAREIQNCSYARRATSPAVFEHLYWIRRSWLEKAMLAEAEALVRDATASLPAS